MFVYMQYKVTKKIIYLAILKFPPEFHAWWTLVDVIKAFRYDDMTMQLFQLSRLVHLLPWDVAVVRLGSLTPRVAIIGPRLSRLLDFLRRIIRVLNT